MASDRGPVRALLRIGAIACLVGLAGCGETYPPELKGPISGVAYDCKTAGESEPRPEDYVSAVDLDGDAGKDFIIDYGKTCAAERALYCRDEGCSVDVYVSAAAYAKVGGFTALAWHVESGETGAKLVLEQPGASCEKPAGQSCVDKRVWRDGALVSSP